MNDIFCTFRCFRAAHTAELRRATPNQQDVESDASDSLARSNAASCHSGLKYTRPRLGRDACSALCVNARAPSCCVARAQHYTCGVRAALNEVTRVAGGGRRTHNLWRRAAHLYFSRARGGLLLAHISCGGRTRLPHHSQEPQGQAVVKRQPLILYTFSFIPLFLLIRG